jgi:hypothetical protein
MYSVTNDMYMIFFFGIPFAHLAVKNIILLRLAKIYTTKSLGPGPLEVFLIFLVYTVLGSGWSE